MKHLPPLLLAATAGLLVVTTACSKKDTPAPTPVITAASKTGTYKLNGTVFTGPATYALGQYYGGSGGDLLTVFIKSGTNASQPTQVATLVFVKPTGAAASTYALSSATITDNSTTPSKDRYFSTNLHYSVTQATSGYSGTFSATSDAGSTYTTAATITEGSFADAMLQ